MYIQIFYRSITPFSPAPSQWATQTVAAKVPDAQKTAEKQECARNAWWGELIICRMQNINYAEANGYFTTIFIRIAPPWGLSGSYLFEQHLCTPWTTHCKNTWMVYIQTERYKLTSPWTKTANLLLIINRSKALTGGCWIQRPESPLSTPWIAWNYSNDYNSIGRMLISLFPQNDVRYWYNSNFQMVQGSMSIFPLFRVQYTTVAIIERKNLTVEWAAEFVEDHRS